MASILLLGVKIYHMRDQNSAGCDVCVVQLPIICHRVYADDDDGGNKNNRQAEPHFKGVLYRPAYHNHLIPAAECSPKHIAGA